MKTNQIFSAKISAGLMNRLFTDKLTMSEMDSNPSWAVKDDYDNCFSSFQKWNLQKSACDDGVKNELRLVLAKIGANLSFPGLKMLLNGL